MNAAHLFEAAFPPDERKSLMEEALRTELGREATPDEVSDRIGTVLVGGRANYSDDNFDADDVTGAVVISAEEVADYWATLPEGVDALDFLDVVAPPFDRMFVEFQNRRSKLSGARSWGVLISIKEPVEFEAEADRVAVTSGAGEEEFSLRGGPLWILGASLIAEWQKGKPVGPIARWLVRVDPSGRVMPEGLINGLPPLFAFPLQLSGLDDAAAYSFTNALGPSFLAPALFAISLMHCKNVRLHSVDPPERVSAKHERKTGRPLTRYHVLNIEPMRRILDREGEAQTRGLRHALHICRGHFKTFTEDAPLFGRHTGTYWWPAQLRGSSSEGVVEKDYRIRLDGEMLGAPYRDADEAVTVAPAEVKPDNPDTSQRGRRAHNRTQNLLAQAIETIGLLPRSPSPAEPDFDLAWQDGDTVWVAEVKSTTAKNEEQQMRLAIGQVIRYRQRLATDGRDVRAMIAVENVPFDESWIDLCGREGIALVWPEVMTLALGP